MTKAKKTTGTKLPFDQAGYDTLHTEYAVKEVEARVQALNLLSLITASVAQAQAAVIAGDFAEAQRLAGSVLAPLTGDLGQATSGARSAQDLMKGMEEYRQKALAEQE